MGHNEDTALLNANQMQICKGSLVIDGKVNESYELPGVQLQMHVIGIIQLAASLEVVQQSL
jgi:hypothetical protein